MIYYCFRGPKCQRRLARSTGLIRHPQKARRPGDPGRLKSVQPASDGQGRRGTPHARLTLQVVGSAFQ
jgi:hypothetical protein